MLLIKSGGGTGPMTPGNRQQCIGANSSGIIILTDKRKMLQFGKPLSSERGLFFFKYKGGLL